MNITEMISFSIRCRDAKDGKVRGIQPGTDGLAFEEQDYPGFEFIAPVSTDIVSYEVQLFNPVNLQIYDRLYVNVSVKLRYTIVNSM